MGERWSTSERKRPERGCGVASSLLLQALLDIWRIGKDDGDQELDDLERPRLCITNVQYNQEIEAHNLQVHNLTSAAAHELE